MKMLEDIARQQDAPVTAGETPALRKEVASLPVSRTIAANQRDF